MEHIRRHLRRRFNVTKRIRSVRKAAVAVMDRQLTVRIDALRDSGTL